MTAALKPATFLTGVPGWAVAIFDAAWRGDVREIAAWHAEQPANSGWWDPWRTPPYFSITVRQMCQQPAP